MCAVAQYVQPFLLTAAKRRRVLMAGFLLGLSGLAAADNYALLLTVGEYPKPIPSLAGVAQDAQSGQILARWLGVKAGNIDARQNSALTLAGMQQAFADLQARIQPGDGVFIYFSGHGTRFFDPDRQACSEGLVTSDRRVLTDGLFEDYLQQLGAVASHVVVVLDACFSGGATTRSIPGGFMPKYASLGDASLCRQIANSSFRSLRRHTRGGGGNIVALTAARDNEVALDQPGHGGVATNALLACVQDGTGQSAATLVACAQAHLQQQIPRTASRNFVPQHITAVGAAHLPLSLTVGADTQPTAPAEPSPAPPPGATDLTDPAAFLHSLYRQRNPQLDLQLDANAARFSLGQLLHLTVSSRHSGYLYLFIASGDHLTLLFPNDFDANNTLNADAKLSLPRLNWRLVATGPAGTDTLLAVMTRQPIEWHQWADGLQAPFHRLLDADRAQTQNLLSQQSRGYAATLLTLEAMP